LAQKLGILGGTFNPVHYGHLAAAEEIRDRLKLDRVLFIPSFLPPHKHEEDMPSAMQRLEMVRLAIAGNPNFKLSDIEVRRGGKSYTIDTIEALLQQYPGTELSFITGLDSFLEIQTWKDWERLLGLCSFVVLSRPGYTFADLAKIGFMKQAEKDLRALDAGHAMEAVAGSDGFKVYLELIPFYEISSTDIRARVHGGRTIKYHLPETVEHYIIENKLYA
jgi:nicotinate-nucleotide adenylyltransferase